MAEIENTVNTSGENVQNNINYDELAIKMADIIEKKNAKNENSILRDNFSKLTEEERELAYNAFNDLKKKEANKTADKIAELEKQLAAANETINTYQTEKRDQIVKGEFTKLINSLNFEEDAIKLVTDLIGPKISDCLNDDLSFDNEKANALIQTVIDSYPILNKRKEVKEDFGFNKSSVQTKKTTNNTSLRQALKDNL